jgi:hypothetical protein
LLLPFTKTFSASDTTRYVVNPQTIDGPGSGEVFFDEQGTFPFPHACGAVAVLEGGPTPGSGVEACGFGFGCFSCDTLSCIGAWDSLYVELNGVDVLRTTFVNWTRGAFWPRPIALSAQVGTNSYRITAQAGSRKFLPPLAIAVIVPDQTPTQLRLDASGSLPYLDVRTISASVRNSDGIRICAPEGLEFTFTIVQGMEWAGFGDPFDELADSITVPATTTYDFTRVSLWAFEDEPEEPEMVVVRLTASDPGFAPVYDTLTVLPPSRELAITILPDTVTYGDTVMIVVQRRMFDGTVVSFVGNYEFQFELELGSQAGYISTLDGSRQGDFVVTLEDTVLFIVVEEEPQPDEVLVIVDVGVFDLDTYESFGAEVPIVVRKGEECTLVTIVPDTLAPGDTASVIVMRQRADGTVVQYPPETLFSVTLLAGQGTLIGPSGETSSTMLECVEQGFRYVAPDSITGSSLETHISAVVTEGCGGMRPVGGQSAGKMKDKGEETPRLSLAECPVFASVVVTDCGHPPCGVPEQLTYPPPLDMTSWYRVDVFDPCEVLLTHWGEYEPAGYSWTWPIHPTTNLRMVQPGVWEEAPGPFPSGSLNHLFTVVACADRNNQRWKFDLTSIRFMYGTGVCENKYAVDGSVDIGDGYGPTVGPVSYCAILSVLKRLNTTNYDRLTRRFHSRHVLEVVEIVNRDQHLQDFIANYSPTFRDKVSSISATIDGCSESSNQALERIRSQLEAEFSEFTRTFMNGWRSDPTRLKEVAIQYYKGLMNTIIKRAADENWVVPCQY